MKKNLLILISIISPFVLNAQTGLTSSPPQIPLDDEGMIRYVEVIEEDADAKDLFKRCVKWINVTYKNPNTVTPTRDMVNKKIVIRHSFRLKNTLETGISKDAGEVLYDLIIRFKDGRYRAEITNVILKKTSKFPAENWLADGSHPNPGYLQQLDEFATDLLDSLREGMKPEKEYKEEEW